MTNNRTCIGCRAERATGELVRLHRQATGRIGPGSGGRGAWLCVDSLEACCAQAIRRRAIGRALRLNAEPEGLEDLHERLVAGTRT